MEVLPALGAPARAMRRAPLGDPVVYRVADYELCLRRHEARIVRVETIAEAEAEEETSSTEPVAQPLGEERHL